MVHRTVERLAREIVEYAEGEQDESGLVCMRTAIRNATGSELQFGVNVLRGELGLWEGRWLIAISPLLLASPKEERFILAHELAHWAVRDAGAATSLTDLENVCDAIARAIIFPDIAILETELDGRIDDHGWISDRFELPRRFVQLRLDEFEEAFREARAFSAEPSSGVWRTVPRSYARLASGGN